MDNDIEKFIKDTFDLNETLTYKFKELYGFTFVFKQSIISFNNYVSSGEIKPVGIIYRKHGEICYAPLDKNENVGDIIKCYCESGMFSLWTTTSTTRGPDRSPSRRYSKSNRLLTLTASIP